MTENGMPLFRVRCILALLCAIGAAGPADAVVRAHHHHQPHLIGARPNPNYEPYPPLTTEAPGALDSSGGGYQGEGFSRSTGGVNSMSNDFGTSGVLGHTNGMPSLPH